MHASPYLLVFRSSMMMSRMKLDGEPASSVGVVFAVSYADFDGLVDALRQVSRPSTSSVSNSGGATLRPHTATRMGWNIWPALIFSLAAPGAQRGVEARRA